MKKILALLGFDAAQHSVKVELMAGLTTFLTMSYILAVNPLILSAAGMDKGAIFSATVIAAVIATLVMAFYAKMPFALASGMGLNAYFAYTLVVTLGFTWQQALAAVFVEGVAFILLTLSRPRGHRQCYTGKSAICHLCGYWPLYCLHRTEKWWCHRVQRCYGDDTWPVECHFNYSLRWYSPGCHTVDIEGEGCPFLYDSHHDRGGHSFGSDAYP